jgi:hypothetical protein
MKSGPVRTRVEDLVNEWLFHIKPWRPDGSKSKQDHAVHWEEVG